MWAVSPSCTATDASQLQSVLFPGQAEFETACKAFVLQSSCGSPWMRDSSRHAVHSKCRGVEQTET